MHLEQSERTLKTIRALIQRSQCHKRLSGCSLLVAGCLVLAGRGMVAGRGLPVGADAAFVAVWPTVFALAVAPNAALAAEQGEKRQRALGAELEEVT